MIYCKYIGIVNNMEVTMAKKKKKKNPLDVHVIQFVVKTRLSSLNFLHSHWFLLYYYLCLLSSVDEIAKMCAILP